MDCIVHGIAKSQTGLSGFHFTSLHFDNQVDLAQAEEENPLSHCRPLLRLKFFLLILCSECSPSISVSSSSHIIIFPHFVHQNIRRDMLEFP